MKYLRRLTAVIGLSILVASLTIPALSQAQRVPKTHSDTVIHLKLKESAQVTLNGDQFTSLTGKNLDSVNTSLSSKKTKKKERLLTRSRDEIAKNRDSLRAQGATNTPDLNGYYRIDLQPGTDINKTLSELASNDAVETAYAEPLAPPTPTVTPNYSALQKYLQTAPTGMGVSSIASQAGSTGANVQVADIEYSWNTAHEELATSTKPIVRLANGTPVDPFNDNNHGTAVAGTVLAQRNSAGTDGEASDAKLFLVNAANVEHNWDPANAIITATSRLGAGDVIILEQQAYGPDGATLVPVEWIPEVYDAIKTATASGIIVVEAASNGGANLDATQYGSTFPAGKADSGAIVVGAGAECGSQANRSRMYFSNYGKRVNVQGYGECVTTTGYGDLFNAGANRMYTSTFAGTSSATASIGGAIAVFSSAYEAKMGKVLTPALARQVLTKTGSAQDTTVNPGNIGPLPNIPAALSSLTTADTTAPTTPTGVTVSLNSRNKPVVRWKASTDNTGVAGYQVYRNGAYYATVSTLTFTDTTVTRGTKYTYTVRAYDQAQNYSALSTAVSVKIP